MKCLVYVLRALKIEHLGFILISWQCLLDVPDACVQWLHCVHVHRKLQNAFRKLHNSLCSEFVVSENELPIDKMKIVRHVKNLIKSISLHKLLDWMYW